MARELTHLDAKGASRMVDVSAKPITQRAARATALVRMEKGTAELIREGKAPKGNVFEVARLAGIMAAKRAWELIPLCHPLALESVTVEFAFVDPQSVQVEAQVMVSARTGVEMEAMTAVTVAALTLYDMCKAVDRSMTIERIRLEEKSGGRSGHFRREE